MIRKTEHKHISYDDVRMKYRVVIKGDHICYTEKLEEAIRRRDLELARRA